MKLIIPLICLLLVVNSCAKKVKSEEQVYNNNFESNNTQGIINAQIIPFNGGKVLGNYNASGFSLQINDLPEHDLVKVTFDLYIHDKWEGNDLNTDGPDVWQFLADDQLLLSTTFSNKPCVQGPGLFCPPQSYPDTYPNNYHDPKTAAIRTDLPGLCSMQGTSGWTTQYRIEKTFRHSQKDILFKCLDQLAKNNNADAKCEKSWSVDNIQISTITL